MFYDNHSPLYPCGCREDRGCVRLPLFGPAKPPEPPHPCCPPPSCSCMPPSCVPDPCACRVQNVRIANPCNPMECATVMLGVDECGNLTVCVRRDPPPPMPRKHR
ncbi:MAG: hypothetical protein PUD50_02900 [Eubacteriales bacterium]|nr:hypothetical protein [Eubacteriales bacterium]